MRPRNMIAPGAGKTTTWASRMSNAGPSERATGCRRSAAPRLALVDAASAATASAASVPKLIDCSPLRRATLLISTEPAPADARHKDGVRTDLSTLPSTGHGDATGGERVRHPTQ